MNAKSFLKGKFALLPALVLVLALLCGCETQPEASPSAPASMGTQATENAEILETAPVTEATEPTATTPADGNPDDITCQGSYSATGEEAATAGDDVIGVISVTTTETVEVTEPAEETEAPTETEASEESEVPEETEVPAETEIPEETEPSEPVYETVTVVEEYPLTNSQLQAFYWLEVATYQSAGHEIAPDFSQPLDTQICPLDETVGSWQQYFLQKALNTWAVSRALTLHSQLVPLGFEEAYQPNADKHAEYFVDVAARNDYYGSHEYYTPNALHQDYLDNLSTYLSQLAEAFGYADAEELVRQSTGVSAEDLLSAVELYNRGYMYFTELSYSVDPTAEEVEAYFAEHEERYAEAGITRDGTKTVNMRHILMLPKNATVAKDGTVEASENDWNQLYWSAQNKLSKILDTYPRGEGTFATYAANESLDAGTALSGGLYENLTPGQMPEEMDAWLFDDARKPGDTELIRTACGMHIVYFCGATETWYEAARKDLITQTLQQQAEALLELYPAEINYSAIRIGEAKNPVLTTNFLLYQDISHQRYPSAPLYLQQDYPTTRYGAYSIVTHGCGITTMAMLASYMSDTPLTPPMLCARYGRYCTEKGSDRTLYVHTPGEMGFYLKKQVFSPKEALAALEEGYIVVGLQHEGFWTRGGHFLLLEKLNENGTLQIRDSNIYNYSKLDGHKIDEFEWSTIPPAAVSFWIFHPKQTSNPMCYRCADGTGEVSPEALFDSEYLCGKCATALLRRDAYLNY